MILSDLYTARKVSTNFKHWHIFCMLKNVAEKSNFLCVEYFRRNYVECFRKDKFVHGLDGIEREFYCN